MSKRTRQFMGATLASGILLQLASCMPGLNEGLGMFLRDLSLEALAAFLF